MNFQQQALEVIDIELSAIKNLSTCIGPSFNQACDLILKCKGRVIVLGVGKSGHIGGKIAATLASTGTPSFWIHAGEASHGDLGMITDKDLILAISFSGKTLEILALLPRIQKLGIPLISITGNPNSKLAKAANIHLPIDIEREACPLNLAPTASTTATLVLGDALAVSLLKARGFTKEDFAFSHPGGNLGKQLLLTVQNLMHPLENTPCVSPDSSLQDTIIEISKHGFGLALVVDQRYQLLGIFTDGDLRRTYQKNSLLLNPSVASVMTRSPKFVHPEEMSAKALNIMEVYKITALPVVSSEGIVQGVIHMHDILQAVIEKEEA